MSRHAASQPRSTDQDTVESKRAELVATLTADLPVMRLLWVLARGMNMGWCLRDLADRGALRKPINDGFVVPPQEELIAFHLTDAGRLLIRDWYLAIRHHRTEPDFSEAWHAVTNR